MSFRPLSTADYAEYHSLINEFRPTTFTEDQFRQTLDFLQRSGTVWVYEEGGVLLATGTVFYERKFIFNVCTYAHIEDVCVRATHRRLGLGKRLLRHIVSQSRDCYKITLDCANENVPFYESCGLERRGNQMCQLLGNLAT